MAIYERSIQNKKDKNGVSTNREGKVYDVNLSSIHICFKICYISLSVCYICLSIHQINLNIL